MPRMVHHPRPKRPPVGPVAFVLATLVHCTSSQTTDTRPEGTGPSAATHPALPPREPTVPKRTTSPRQPTPSEDRGAPASPDPRIPRLQAWVNDYANLLDAPARDRLTRKLRDYERRTGHQFALLTIETLNGEAIEAYSLRVAKSWGLGDRRRNDGVLVTVAVKDRQIRIEVGTGLEVAISDPAAQQILADIRPIMGRGDFEAAFNDAFDRLMDLAKDTAVRSHPPQLR